MITSDSMKPTKFRFNPWAVESDAEIVVPEVMDEQGFWQIIDSSFSPDLEQQIVSLGLYLDALRPAALRKFARLWAGFDKQLYCWQIWEAADIMIGDTSDDVFTDFRAWLITRGRAVFEAVLADHDAGLAGFGHIGMDDVATGEGFIETVESAFESITDRPLDDVLPNKPRGSKTTGNREERRAEYPNLAALYPLEEDPLTFPWRN
jgi:hypothetical protein